MSAVQVKICGITRVEDALEAISLGADMLGLNFYAPSPRHITLANAQQIATAVAGRARLIGVFVNMNLSELLATARAVPLAAVQLHGSESLADARDIATEFPVIRALSVNEHFTIERAREYAFCEALLLDAPTPDHGGSGQQFDWTRVPWQQLREQSQIFLAGGLDGTNVAEAISIAQPHAVDVSSGVESSKGIKSAPKMREFIAAVRAAERQLV